jgi:hypothetical protein
LDPSTMTNFGIKDLDIQGLILYNVNILNNMRVFVFYEKFIIANKLQKLNEKRENHFVQKKMKKTKFEKTIEELCSVEALKKSYLNSNKKAIQELLDRLSSSPLEEVEKDLSLPDFGKTIKTDEDEETFSIDSEEKISEIEDDLVPQVIRSPSIST